MFEAQVIVESAAPTALVLVDIVGTFALDGVHLFVFVLNTHK